MHMSSDLIDAHCLFACAELNCTEGSRIRKTCQLVQSTILIVNKSKTLDTIMYVSVYEFCNGFDLIY